MGFIPPFHNVCRCHALSGSTYQQLLYDTLLLFAGPDTSKGLLISVGAAAALAVVTFSFTGKPPTAKQASDVATKINDLNEF